MRSASASPKRRHILSSINPDTERPQGADTEGGENAATAQGPASVADEGHERDGHVDATRPRRTRLKLKGERSRHRPRDEHSHDSSSSHRYRHRHRRHRHRSPTPPNPHDPPPLDPEAAFRESLFDAMADDEGASYWEGVYGQPVHIYSSDKVGPSGELEQMTDEEYAAYVRQKMWEKTHAGLLEEKARREEERKRKREEERRDRRMHEEMERSLRRGEERREKRRWAERWEAYAQSWATWDGTLDSMSWPLEGLARRKAEDILEKDVREFFILGLDLEGAGEKDFAAKLKEERVRWHPDKIQQRLGARQVDTQIMKDVTAIFQIVDKLWNEMRSEKD